MKTFRHYLLLGSCFAALGGSTGARAQDANPKQSAQIATTSHAPSPPPANVEINLPPPNQINQEERAQGSPTRPRSDPYPVQAAGWAKPRSNYFFDSRWEEDWTPLQQAGEAPPLKAMPLFNNEVRLTVNAEDRFRTHTYTNGQLVKGNNYTEVQNRLLIGADLHVTPYFRLYTEFGRADLSENGHPDVQSVTGKQENSLSLQQMFGDFNYHMPGVLVGAMVGRMEYTDAPPQLISVGNGPNLLQTWNGYRVYLHTDRFRLGYFQAYPTDQNLGGYFNQTVSHGEWLKSVVGSVKLLNTDPRHNLFLAPLYIDNFNQSIAEGNSTGVDHRYTYGAELTGRLGPVTLDWMGYDQTGDHAGRPASAFLTSLLQTVKITPFGFPIDIGFRFDVASGGGGLNKTGPTHLFNPIYTDKGIYGEAEIFSYQNVLIPAPLASIRLTLRLLLNLEYDIVYRENTRDAFYTPSKPYLNTQKSSEPYAGGQTRVNFFYNLSRNVFLRLELDQFHAGNSLRQAHFTDAFNVMPDITIRY